VQTNFNKITVSDQGPISPTSVKLTDG